jgi:hypothetical protein
LPIFSPPSAQKPYFREDHFSGSRPGVYLGCSLAKRDEFQTINARSPQDDCKIQTTPFVVVLLNVGILALLAYLLLGHNWTGLLIVPIENCGLSSRVLVRLIKPGKLGDNPMQDERYSLFGNARRTRVTLLLLAFLCVGILALVAGYLFLGLSFDPYNSGRFLW